VKPIFVCDGAVKPVCRCGHSSRQVRPSVVQQICEKKSENCGRHGNNHESCFKPRFTARCCGPAFEGGGCACIRLKNRGQKISKTIVNSNPSANDGKYSQNHERAEHDPRTF